MSTTVGVLRLPRAECNKSQGSSEEQQAGTRTASLRLCRTLRGLGRDVWLLRAQARLAQCVPDPRAGGASRRLFTREELELGQPRA